MPDTIDFKEDPQIDFLADEDVAKIGVEEPQRAVNQAFRTMQLGALAAPEPRAPTPPLNRVVGKYGLEPAPGTQTLLGPQLGKLAQAIPPGQGPITRPLSSLGRTALGFGEAALQPENLAATSLAISPPGALATGAYFGYQAGKGAIQSVRNIIKLMQAPGPVDAEFKQKLSDELVNALSMAVAAGEIGVGEARQIRRMVTTPPIQGPLPAGAILQTPRGAPIPPAESVQPPLTVPSQVSARAATAMSKQATAAYEPGRLPRPEVPVGPSDPRVIQAQNEGLNTIRKVLARFPEMRGNREAARVILRQAFPESAPPPTAPETPETPPPPSETPPEPLPAVQAPETPPEAIPEPPSPVPEAQVAPEAAPTPEVAAAAPEAEPVTVEPASEAPPPAAVPAPTIEATPLAGKTLGEWEAVKTAAELPKGTARAELAKWLAVPNQPARILQALANKRRTREIHAPPPAEVSSVAPTLHIKVGNRLTQVSPEQASQVFAEMRDEAGEGASGIGPLLLTDAQGKQIGHVSYNGKVWLEGVEKPIYTPSGLKQAEVAAAKVSPVAPAPAPEATPAAILEPAPQEPPAEPQVEQAAAKAQAEVAKTAAVEGQRPAKEVKQDLIDALQQALMKAPREAKVGDKVTIEIPGDGTFKIVNAVEPISGVLDRAKKIETNPNKPTKISAKQIAASSRILAKHAAEAPTTETSEPGPGPIGMGGAALGEIQATGPRGEPTHGIAARVLEERRLQGVIGPVEPGEGIGPEESIARGRELLQQGVDPQAVLDEFNRTHAVSADAIAVARAYGERLARTAYAMADAHGINSPEYEAAWEADSNWAKAMKPMSTEWHKIGQAQQGETEIDTGTFHGLRKAYHDLTGKDFTPKQAEEAVGVAQGVKDSTAEADNAKTEVFANIDKSKDPTVQDVWKRAKVLIDAGEDDFTSLRHKLAIEFGKPVSEITEILAKPKGARKLTDDMYVKQANQRRAVETAKNWLKNLSVPGWLKFIRAVPRVFFTAKILGHGTVGMVTHAGLNIFNPGAWKHYWPNFFRQYKLMVSPGYHERMMQDLLHDPLYTKARRAGLINDPYRYSDDYQTPQMVQWLGKLGLTGNRGFDSLKLFRQARFNQIWNALPDTLQTADYAKLLADSVNHATGVVRRPFREWTNWVFFAPKLEASRWAWMIGDPIKAATTLLDWNKATPEARAFAMSQIKEKAAIAGFYYSLLALNQGLLSAQGSKDQVNFSDPRRSDFLAFKAAGHNIGVVGPLLGMVRLFANIVHASMGKRGKLESLDSRAAEFGKVAEEYARGKLSPFAGFGVDLASQADFQGRPLPFSTDKVPPYLRKQGIGRYTYGEYAAQEFTPIPVSEAIREVWRDQGMKDDEMDAYLKALIVGVVAGGTGARVSVSSSPPPPEKQQKK